MENKRVLAALALALIAVGLSSNPALAGEKTVTVGGAEMYPSRNIIENAANSADHTTLLAAVKKAGLEDTLKSAGPFTVFAPTNAAFAKLPAGTVESLIKPENRAVLTKILTYHVLKGKFDSKSIARAIQKGGGKAEFATVSGGKLKGWMEGKNLYLSDEKGGKSLVSQADVYQKNGVIHVIDTVLLPQ